MGIDSIERSRGIGGTGGIGGIGFWRAMLVSGVLAASLGAGVVQAQAQAPAPGAAAPAAPAAAAPASPAEPAHAVDPAAVDALKAMGVALQALKRFEVRIDLTSERVLEDGQKLQHTAGATLQVDRPNRMRVAMLSARNERELFYDGKTVTLYTPALKYYSQLPYVDTLGALIVALKEKYNIQVPATDLFVWGTPAAPLNDFQSAMFAGQDYVGGVLCDLLAFREGQLDWQVWVAAEGEPLPHKLVITNRADDARPQSVTMMSWNLHPTFKDSSFSFVPPKGAKEIPVVPVKQ